MITSHVQSALRPLAIAASTILVLSLLTPSPVSGDLIQGDLAIIGISSAGESSDTADEFSWVPLIDLPAGTIIYFSDAGYDSGANGGTGGFIATGNNSETLLRYIVPTGGIAAGAAQTVITNSTNPNYQRFLNTQFGDWHNTDPRLFSFTVVGEELIAFQSADNPSNANFGTDFQALFAVDTGHGTSGLFQFDGSQSASTDLHPQLTLGTSAVGLRDTAGNVDFDNIRYIGPTVGTREFLFSNIANSSNWEGTIGPDPVGWTNANGDFDVVATPEPSTLLFSGLATLLLAARTLGTQKCNLFPNGSRACQPQ